MAAGKRHRDCLTIILALGAVVPLLALAQDAPLHLQWHAPAQCPSEADVRREVVRLLGQKGMTQRVLSARVDIEVRDGVWRARMQSPAGERSLEAESCRTLSDVVALILALAIDPNAKITPANASTSIAPMLLSSGAAAESVVGVVTATSSAVGSGHSSDPTLPAIPSGATSSSALPASNAPTTLPGTSVLQEAVDSSPLSPEKRKRTQSSLTNTSSFPGRYLANLELGLDAGSLPALGPGLSVNIGILWPYFRLTTGLEGWRTRTTNLATSNAIGGSFSLLAGRLEGCLRVNSNLPTWEFCGAAEIGRMTGAGFGVTQPDRRGTLWIAPEAAAAVAWPLGRRLEVRGALGIAVPLLRPEFQLAGIEENVYRASAVVGRASLGLDLLF